jgi:hypothetical protein
MASWRVGAARVGLGLPAAGRAGAARGLFKVGDTCVFPGKAGAAATDDGGDSDNGALASACSSVTADAMDF